MKRIIFLFTLYILLICSAFALTSDEKGIILENFKSLEYDMLFESDSMVLSEDDLDAISMSRRVNIYSDIKDSVTKKRKYAQIINLQNLKMISTLEELIGELDDEIDTLTKNVAKINTEIIQIKEDIESNTKIIELLRNRVEDSKEVLLDYLEYVYKKGNYVYDENSIDNLKAIIFYGDDISTIINDLYFKSVIQIAGKRLIDDHREHIKNLYLEKVTLERKELRLKQLRKNEIIQRKVIEDKKLYKERILEQTKGKESIFRKYIEDKLALERTIKLRELKEKIKFKNVQNKLLEKYSCEFVDLADDNGENLAELSDDCYKLNKTIASEYKLKGFVNNGNIFSWPVLPTNGISAFYRDSEYKELFGSDHDAIDIVVDQGTNIRAPADGYVIFVLPPDDENYSYFAIKHSNGYVTVYGHVSEIFVKELDFVEKGDFIAKTGGELGTPGAGVMTTGPHLHFEVFSDKEPVDPLNFLDLSYFRFDSLPQKYKYKFLSDYKERRGFEYQGDDDRLNAFRIEGANEAERQRYLLEHYATTTFRDWDMWVEESLEGNIDPSFVMCIGLAETGLGRNLKTRYNIGNVGNTDSGATSEFMNARSGIHWIVKTLNNRILGHYDKVKDLSRYGNDTGPIYASSPDHWHNNIVKCLSALKGVYVPDDYKFRIQE